MTAFCSSCGSSLAADVRFCPHCGTPTGSYYSNSGASPHEPTASAAPSQIPATKYGVDPSGMPLQNPYEPLNPYLVPPPPPRPRRPVTLGLLIGLGALVLLIVGISIGALLTQHSKNTPTGYTNTPTRSTSLPTATSAPTSIPATATVHAEKIPYPPYSGNLVLNDPLKDNGKGYGWDDNGDYCTFAGGDYQASEAASQGFHTCAAENTNFSNFAYQVQMNISKGNAGGIIFRANNGASKFYYWRIFTDGTYSLTLFVNSLGTSAKTLKEGSLRVFHTGLNQMNSVAVVAQGSKIDLYINQQPVTSVNDTTYTSGQIGVTAENIGDATAVLYSNAQVWEL